MEVARSNGKKRKQKQAAPAPQSLAHDGADAMGAEHHTVLRERAAGARGLWVRDHAKCRGASDLPAPMHTAWKSSARWLMASATSALAPLKHADTEGAMKKGCDQTEDKRVLIKAGTTHLLVMRSAVTQDRSLPEHFWGVGGLEVAASTV